MIDFNISTDSATGNPMVEVWRDGEFIADIYGHQDGIRVVSKYLDGVQHEAGSPPALVIRFGETPPKE